MPEKLRGVLYCPFHNQFHTQHASWQTSWSTVCKFSSRYEL